jgi:hypothetical protein
MELQNLEGIWKLGALKDTSQAPQTARSRILPEPRSTEAKECKGEKSLQVCTLCCMLELSTRLSMQPRGCLRPTTQEPRGEGQWPIKVTQWAIYWGELWGTSEQKWSHTVLCLEQKPSLELQPTLEPDIHTTAGDIPF